MAAIATWNTIYLTDTKLRSYLKYTSEETRS